MARLSSMLAGFMGSKTKVTDFMPSYTQEESKKEKMKALASSVIALFGGKS